MKDSVFVHFCGTLTSTENMVTTMAADLNFFTQIYINGPGADKSYPNHKKKKCPGANNSYYSIF